MCILLGIIAIITAISNLVFTFLNKDAKWFRFISMSFTALTICSFYSANIEFVLKGDLNALMDIVPSLSKTLFILTIISILINSVSLFKKNK